MNICVVGLGHIGIVTATFLVKIGHNVIGYDENSRKVSFLNQGIPTIQEPGIKQLMTKHKDSLNFTNDIDLALKNIDLVIVACDLKTQDNGLIDLEQIYKYISLIKSKAKHSLHILIKARVPVGTTARIEAVLNKNSSIKFDVSYQSEILFEGTALQNIDNQPRLIIGINSINAHTKLVELYEYYYNKGTFIYFTNPQVAEVVNHSVTNYLAVNTSFINELCMACEEIGLDGLDVVRALNSQIKGIEFLPTFGYEQKELPNANSLNNWLNSDSKILSSVATAVEINSRIPRHLVSIILKKYNFNLQNIKIGFLGLCSNKNLTEMGNSQAIPLIKMLIGEGAKIIAYDPKVEANFKNLIDHQPKIKYVADVRTLLKQVDCVIVLNDSEEFINLGSDDFIKYMKTPVIFDVSNILDDKKMQNVDYIRLIGKNSQYLNQEINYKV